MSTVIRLLFHQKYMQLPREFTTPSGTVCYSLFLLTLHSFLPMAKRTAGKPKPKSIKSKSINKNSKRKLAVLGKQQKKGYAGDAIMYMTRSQALRKLGLSLKDFR